MLRRPHAAALLALALLVALVAPATAQVPNPLSGRIVPEPSERATYLSLSEFEGFLDELDATFGDFMTIGSMGQSEEGREMLEVELTDPGSSIPYAERGVVYLSQSIHSNEPGGREGMIRVIEDILIDAAAGDAATLELLGKLRLVQTIVNPDSWASGDLPDIIPPGYRRENAEGVDLNRELPWPGFVSPGRDFAKQAESTVMVADVDARRAAGERIVATGDVHGMIQDEAAVWTLLSSGQFDVGGWVRQRAMGAAIAERVDTALDDTALFTLAGLAEPATGQQVTPHRLTSSSEFKGGLSGSGFYGDFLAQPSGLDSPSVSTIELFFNNGPFGTFNQTTFNPELVQIHVDSVRAIVGGILEAALTDYEVSIVPAGRVGVVQDPRTVMVPNPQTRRTEDAKVTPMRFFDDLDAFLPEATARLSVADLGVGVPADLAVLVVSSDSAVEDPAALTAIGDFAKAGGTLVLTDAGLKALAAIDERFAADGAVTRQLTNIGNADFTDFGHPLAEGLRDAEFEETLHTYEPSTLGYKTTSGRDREAPVWRVDRGAWETAGGATVATTGGQTSIGELRLTGGGTVRVIGGLLPMPTTVHNPPFGLSSYAPNDTGTFVFVNALGGAFEVDEVEAAFGAPPESSPETGAPAAPGAGPDTGPGDEPSPGPSPSPAAGSGDEPSPGPSPSPAAGSGDEPSPGPTGGSRRGASPAGAASVEPRLTRVSGPGRVETAARASAERYDSAETVVIANAGDYPDALAGAPLSADLGAPLLLSDRAGLSAATSAEIERLGATEAVLLGGTAALSAQVAQDLEVRGLAIERVSGTNRFATAAAIAQRLGGDTSTAFLAAGGPPPDAPDPSAAGWPDAVAVAPYAAFRGAPILLTNRDALPVETVEALAALGVAETVVVGGSGVVAPVVIGSLTDGGHGPRRLAGPTRYGTSRAVVDEAVGRGMAADRLWLATGRAFPDALGAGPVVAALGESLLLVDGRDLGGSPETAALLGRDTTRVRLLGGPAALSAAVEAQVLEAIGG